MQKNLRISGIEVAITSEGHPWSLEGSYPLFEVTEQAGDVRIEIHWDGSSSDGFGEQLFQFSRVPFVGAPTLSPVMCRIYRGRGGLYAFETVDPKHPVFSRRLAVFEPDFRHGDLHVELGRDERSVYPNPFLPFLDRLLITNLLAHRTGILVHACGILYGGRSYVFLGPSGAGKTTMAGLWATFDDVEILGDENLILRKNGSEFWAYGSPWAKEPALCSPSGAPIAAIYFIRHATENLLTPITVRHAMERLLVRTSLLMYDRVLIENQLALCSMLVSAVPAYDFGFVPDLGAVTLLRRTISGDRTT